MMVSRGLHARITALAYLRVAVRTLHEAHSTLSAIEHPDAELVENAITELDHPLMILQAGAEDCDFCHDIGRVDLDGGQGHAGGARRSRCRS